LRRAALERLDVPEAERLEGRQIEASDGAGDVRQRVRPLVTEVSRVWQFSRPDGVQHNDARTRHIESYPTRVADALGIIGILAFIACVVALAAGITWIVVKVSPNPNRKKTQAES
jgi:hypothetical protein